MILLLLYPFTINVISFSLSLRLFSFLPFAAFCPSLAIFPWLLRKLHTWLLVGIFSIFFFCIFLWLSTYHAKYYPHSFWISSSLATSLPTNIFATMNLCVFHCTLGWVCGTLVATHGCPSSPLPFLVFSVTFFSTLLILLRHTFLSRYTTLVMIMMNDLF